MIKTFDKVRYIVKSDAFSKTHNEAVKMAIRGFRSKLAGMEGDAVVTFGGRVGGRPPAPTVTIKSDDPDLVKRIEHALHP